MKENVTQFDLSMAFKELDQIAVPASEKRLCKRTLEENLKSYREAATAEALLEDYYDVSSHDDLEQAKEDREDEIAKAKLARIEKIVDLDAETADDILPSYVGKMIIQCPQCMTLFYKDEADIEHSDDGSDVVNVNETCQHCGNTSGYTLIGKVDKVGADEAEQYDASAFDAEEGEEENDLNLDFDDEPEIPEETGEEAAAEETSEEETSDEDLNIAETSEESEEEEVEESLHKAEAAPSDHETENKSENVTLNEDVDKDLDEKLKAHTEYIEYLRKELECAECELEKASNDFVKDAIQRKIDSLKADLDAAIPDEVKDAVDSSEEIADEPIEDTAVEEETTEAEELAEEPITDPAAEEEIEESLNKAEAAPSEHETENKAEAAKSLHEELEDEDLTEALGEDELKAFRANKAFEGLTDKDIKKAVIMYVKFRQMDGELAKDKTSKPEDVAEFIEDCGGWGGFADEVYSAIFDGDIVGKPDYENFVHWILKDAKYVKAVKKFGKEFNLLDECETDEDCIKAVFDNDDRAVWEDTFKAVRRIYLKEEAEADQEGHEKLEEAFWDNPDKLLKVNDKAPSYKVVRAEGGKQTQSAPASTFKDADNVAKKMATKTPNAQIIIYAVLGDGRDNSVLKQYAYGKTYDHVKDVINQIKNEKAEEKAIAKANKNISKKSAKKSGSGEEPNTDIQQVDKAGDQQGEQQNEQESQQQEQPQDKKQGGDNQQGGEEQDTNKKPKTDSKSMKDLYNSVANKLIAAGVDIKALRSGKKEKGFTKEFRNIIRELKGLPLVEDSVTEGVGAEFDALSNTREFNSPVSDAELSNILSDLDNLVIEDLNISPLDDVEDIDEESVEKCLTESLTNVYKNVKSFSISGCEIDGNNLIVEGIITFNSGKSKSTAYTFACESFSNSGEYKASGLNESLNKDGKFNLTYFLEDNNTDGRHKKLFASKVGYSYKINESLVEGSSEMLYE